MNADEPIILSKAEAEEIWRYTQNAYLDPNMYPALRKLMDRIWRYIRVHA